MGVTSRIKVVKASGEMEVFDPNMVTSDCLDAGVDFWTAVEVAQEVAKRIRDGISTREIQQETLRVLYALNPEAAERYKRYHSMYVRTSRNTIEAFDRKKIVESLILETSLPREIAENIAREAEGELRRLKLEFISAPLIREVVNVKLLEHGFEEARANYTRLGMPVYDASRLVDGMAGDAEQVHRSMAANVLKEYVLLKVLPLALADAHMKGDLHIHALDSFATKASSFVHDLRPFLIAGVRDGGVATPPPESAVEAVLTAVNLLRHGAGSFSTSQCLEHLNVYLAPYLRGLEEGEVERLARMLLYQLAQLGGRCEVCLEYGVPSSMSSMEAVLPGGEMDGTTYSEFEEEACSLATAIARSFASGDYLGRPFASPGVHFRLREEYEGKEGYLSFLELAHTAAASGAEHLFSAPPPGESAAGSHILEEGTKGPTAGMLQVVTLNLPRIAYQSDGSDRRLFELLEERVKLSMEALALKRELLSRRVAAGMLPVLEECYGSASLLLGVGYVGLNEMLLAHLGAELHREEAMGFAKRVMGHMRGIVEQAAPAGEAEFVLVQATEEAPHRRLARLDHGIFAHRIALPPGREEVCYTPASWVREDAELPLARRLEIEGEFHALCRGGAVSVITLREEMPEVPALMELSRRISRSSRVRFWKFSGRGGCS
ncbi:MAG: anaerobic ribonucleoside-triphosphate reductase [Euryarchaeota archaeon]|nr:anaerobic ribonucleoside-triphosphate reductase [Euryarchaeota archaeon]